jgi:hypothetical protein
MSVPKIDTELPLPELLGREFAGVLRSWLTPTQMAQVLRSNAQPENKAVCASHDYCDANQAMLDAFTRVFKVEMDLSDEDCTTLWGTAWDLAKASEFFPPTQQYASALIEAEDMMSSSKGLEPTSALKEAASQNGIEFGAPMERFVRWANIQLFG